MDRRERQEAFSLALLAIAIAILAAAAVSRGGFWMVPFGVGALGAALVLARARLRDHRASRSRLRALEESEARYRALVDAAPDGIVVLTGSEIVFANAAAARIFGAGRADDLLGRSGPSLIAPESAPLITRRIRDVERFGLATAPLEVRARRLDGAEVEVELRGLPVTFAGERADLSIVRDLTEKRQAEAERDRLSAATREQAVTRDLVRRMLRETSGLSRAPAMRALGRSLAQDVPAASLPDFLHAFETMGGGRFGIEAQVDGRFIVVGKDLLERRAGATQPTCALPLGFLEGAVARMHEGVVLGTETRCQSLGHEACVFVVQARAAPEGPRVVASLGLGKPS